MKPIFLKIIAVCCGLVFALFFAEIGLRIIGVYQPPPFYSTDPKTKLSILNANAEGYWKKSCLSAFVRINSLGWRDDEFTNEKPQGTFRTAVIGDSFVEAMQVPLEKTFHKLLENKLKEDGLQNEVLAIGKSGNGLYYAYLYLKNYVLQYKPDLLVINFVPLNDIRDDSLELSERYARQEKDYLVLSKQFPIIHNGKIQEISTALVKQDVAQRGKFTRFFQAYLKPWLQQLQLFSFFYPKAIEAVRKIENFRWTTSGEESQPSNVNTEIFLKNYDAAWISAWETEDFLIGAIKKLADENGIKVAMFSAPDVMWPSNPAGYDKKKFESDKPEKLMAKIAQKYSIPFLNLTPVFQENSAPRESFTFTCDKHLNEKGHALTADALYYFLKTQHLIGRNTE